MSIICKDDEITIRELENTDYDMNCMLKWLNNKNVSDYYGDSRKYILEEIKNKYTKKIESSFETPCIIEYNNNPIGYIQYFLVDSDEYEILKEIYEKIIKKSEKAMAFDLFIGEDKYRDRGFGTRIIKLLINELFKDKSINAILIDPRTSNKRAIECYRKCGFKDVCIIPKREEKDGIWIGNLIGENGVAVITNCYPLTYIVTSISSGLAIATSVMVS